MACILNIETSTNVCSAALAIDGRVAWEKTSYEGHSHATLLGVYVEEALHEMQAKGGTLDAVAVSSGPGSYTGLRIGVSLAKGLCFGLGIPLLSIPTLKLLAHTAIQTRPIDDALYCPMIDARRMEVYAALFDSQLRPVRPAQADIVAETSYAEYLSAGKVCFFGDGAAKCQPVLTQPNALFLENIYPLAANMARLAEEAYAAKQFEDVAYFEPFYLKEFQATIAKNKVLGNH